MEVEVPFDLLALFTQQHRQQIARAEAPAEPRPQLGVQGRPRVIDRVAVLAEELAPHLHVALFDAGELDVDVLAMRIGFLAGEGEVEEGCVGFILPMVEPGVDVGVGHAASYYWAML